MKLFKKKSVVVLIFSICLGIGGLLIVNNFSYSEEPYQAKMWSPNREYYLQKYKTVNLIQLPSMPGQGSDEIDGYIRIYDKTDKLIHERFYSFIRDTEPIWSGNSVVLLGGGVTDDDVVVLPSSAE